MKLFGFNITRDKIESENFQAFSSPFQKVGDGNLSLPVVKSYVKNQYVPFGSDNLFPQLLNQLYYTSPLHGAIVDFKVNAILGGGYELQKRHLSTKEELEVKRFEMLVKLPQFTKMLLQELIVHNRIYIIGTKTKDGAKYKKHICPSKVRANEELTIYYLSDDWSLYRNVRQIKKYKDAKIGEEFIWCYENHSLGQDVYPLPTYSSANNWSFLDGEMSYLQKSNILNSIFPSYAMMFPRKPSSEEEKQEIRDAMGKLKGAENAGKAAAFFGVGKDNMPEIFNFPTNNNDNLFQATTESIDSKICQAHTIDPILMGIRVSGKLGSGSDIKQSYVIFEKNVIMPLRDEIEMIMNSIFQMFGVKTKMSINEFQIIGEQIVDKGADTPVESVSDNDVELNTNLRGLSAQENMDMIRVVRDFNKGKLTEPIAKARLASYGFDAETIKEILSL